MLPDICPWLHACLQRSMPPHVHMHLRKCNLKKKVFPKVLCKKYKNAPWVLSLTNYMEKKKGLAVSSFFLFPALQLITMSPFFLWRLWKWERTQNRITMILQHSMWCSIVSYEAKPSSKKPDQQIDLVICYFKIPFLLFIVTKYLNLCVVWELVCLCSLEMNRHLFVHR